MLSKLPPIYWPPLPLPLPLGICASQQPLQASGSCTPPPATALLGTLILSDAGLQLDGSQLQPRMLAPGLNPHWPPSCLQWVQSGLPALTSLSALAKACVQFLCPNHTRTAGICVTSCTLSFVDMYSGNVVYKLILHIGLFDTLTNVSPSYLKKCQSPLFLVFEWK